MNVIRSPLLNFLFVAGDNRSVFSKISPTRALDVIVPVMFYMNVICSEMM